MLNRVENLFESDFMNTRGIPSIGVKEIVQNPYLPSQHNE